MKQIEHRQGVVTAIHPGELVVRIVQLSACSGCHAKDFCCSTDCKDHYLNIETRSEGFALGDQVIVEAEVGIGRLAVLLAFVVPILLLVLSLVVSTLFLMLSELMAVLGITFVLGLYYSMLYLCRHHLKRIVRFGVRKIDQD
ncbi:SoxR reducing system RseC family protein [Porphyromonas sp. COT-239 OH1446]|uniref:SoxR reducing system RseC family protein n=1 Tax=Porphyromonas sp. COT-239 OH1446 TaxID=1515613 RepID=UPI00052BF3D9|nr:SoxR reducing system RseC family protein [Porphyromonas sp. COT-239 OH1446]KGN71254.1 hypothetical protein HQ37_02030 [Porphyromonas sp. COT-239 OH1446]